MPRFLLNFFSSTLIAIGLVSTATAASEKPKGIFELSAASIDGETLPLSTFQGKVLLVVNTASKCGFTPQYRDLEALYEQYKDRGLEILGFPSNDFLNQEPGTNEEIRRFCQKTYGVTFPLFARGPVSGKEKQEVFKFLTEKSPEEFRGDVGWNFEKFIVGRDGKVKARFGSFVNPQSGRIRDAIEEQLNSTNADHS